MQRILALIVGSLVLSGCGGRGELERTELEDADDSYATVESPSGSSAAMSGRREPEGSPWALSPVTTTASPATPSSGTSASGTASSAAPSSGTPLELLTADLIVPVAGVKRSELRDSYEESRGGRVHEALDIPAARGTPVLSAVDGRLLKIFDSEAGGLMVYATDASERFILLYGHLEGYADGLTEGMSLTRGQVIGYVGTTGNAAIDVPHLHFGILVGDPAVSWWEGRPVNPYPLLAL